ncbi:hypothetical protein [Micromonospora sp. KLBMP9576]|uniref:hypothetical protein n=1 Tax=Micromonospora sp. KLBMP9576 TaxID=3424769 RepID=UPI003D92D5CE
MSSGPPRVSWATIPADEERYRPLYARVLGLRFVNPGGVLCFLFFEGAVALAALLALAELVTWWAVLVLPLTVAAMVKLNDVVAAMVVRSAALVPEQERDRFRQQVESVVGRARVDRTTHGVPGVVVAVSPVPQAIRAVRERQGRPDPRHRAGDRNTGPQPTRRDPRADDSRP